MIWDAEPPPPRPAAGAREWGRIAIRGPFLAAIVGLGLCVSLILRLIEKPIFGRHRPMTPHVTVSVCRIALRILGLRRIVHGRPMTAPGAMVSNHVSWLDCFTLNAGGPLYFVSKSEVGSWPGIGWLAHATGTVFIRRDPREADRQRSTFEERLRAGHRLLFFPEGTSTDGLRVLDFKSTLFAAFFAQEFRHDLAIQPITLRYVAPPGAHPAFYGWWGDMAFGPHLVDVLAAPAGGKVEIFYHDPVAVADTPDRKALAKRAGAVVRARLLASAEQGAER